MPAFRGRHNHPTRRIAEWALDVALMQGLFAKWSYRCGLHGVLRVTRYEVKALPGALSRPLVVAFASDFHSGPTTHPEIFALLFDQLAAVGPDVLLLGGDFVSCKARYSSALVRPLSACKPPLGKYAVFGNHDLWTDERLLERSLRSAGVEVLVNRNVALPPPFDRVSICGIDDPWTGDPDVVETFKDANPVRIFLTHSPDGVILLGDERYDVGFAGHTHGGQIALADGTPIVVPHGPMSRTFSRGRFEIEGRGPLIVSTGVGCSMLPIRVNADPELVICTLR